MAHRGLALAELGAKGADVAFAFGQDQDHLEAGGVAHMLEQDRRSLGLLEPLIVIILGVVVGSMVVAMYLPIFKLASVV